MRTKASLHQTKMRIILNLRAPMLHSMITRCSRLRDKEMTSSINSTLTIKMLKSSLIKFLPIWPEAISKTRLERGLERSSRGWGLYWKRLDWQHPTQYGKIESLRSAAFRIWFHGWFRPKWRDPEVKDSQKKVRARVAWSYGQNGRIGWSWWHWPRTRLLEVKEICDLWS